MPRYFFDIHDGRTEHVKEFDEEGVMLASAADAAKYTRKFLPEIAAHEAAMNEEHQTYTVLVSDEEGQPVYSAALYYVGSWPDRSTYNSPDE